MNSDAASNLLAILQVVAIVVGCFYVAILATIVRFLAEGWLEKRRDRRRWQEHDELARQFRSELDTVDLGEELRQRGRAA
jgi:hypothetical protein